MIGSTWKFYYATFPICSLMLLSTHLGTYCGIEYQYNKYNPQLGSKINIGVCVLFFIVSLSFPIIFYMNYVVMEQNALISLNFINDQESFDEK